MLSFHSVENSKQEIDTFRSLGANLPGAVGANAPKGKGSVGACIQSKNWCIYYFIRVFFKFNLNCTVDYWVYVVYFASVLIYFCLPSCMVNKVEYITVYSWHWKIFIKANSYCIMRNKAINANCIGRPSAKVTNLRCFELHFTFF